MNKTIKKNKFKKRNNEKLNESQEILNTEIIKLNDNKTIYIRLIRHNVCDSQNTYSTTLQTCTLYTRILYTLEYYSIHL